ncbi:MAG: ATP-binding protein [Lactobacillales bacterium]|jgi:predicted AAA+ superfamily ATPase|nr:ATP-binding protein [Lactobacillales bacterium]
MKKLIERPLYLEKIIPLIDVDLVKVLVGFRRSGKSKILELIKKHLLENGRKPEQFIELNFEEYANIELQDPTLLNYHLVNKVNEVEGKAYIFLDEIQEVKGFEKVINSLRTTLDVDIYITGSNAKLLSGELATYLAGRYIQIYIYPFSFQEYLSVKGDENISNKFLEYIKEGGMPQVVADDLPAEINKGFLRDVYNSVVLKDIIERQSIRNPELLDRTILYAFANIARVIEAKNVVKYLKNEQRPAKVDTLMNYLQYAKDAFLLYPIKKHDVTGKEIFKSQEKYFIVDNGLREAIIGRNDVDIQLVLENTVALEGIRRGYDVTVGEINGKEIDFIFAKDGEKVYVQVSYLLAEESTVKREFAPFYEVKDNYRKVVVSLDPILQPRDGIEHLRIEDFLLEEKW